MLNCSILFRLVVEEPQKDGPLKETPLLPHAYSEHRFSDHFIYGYRDFYVDVYRQETREAALPLHTFSKVVEYEQHIFLVKIDSLWGAYDFSGTKVRDVTFNSMEAVISSFRF